LISKELHRQAKAQAALEGKSLSALLNELVAAYLADKEAPAKLTKRGA
jgi:predicted HicB family RNase H-like nuclease